MSSLLIEDNNKAYEILKTYNGSNPYIYDLKKMVFIHNKTLNSFQIDYIIRNAKTIPILLNKIIKISKWYGLKKQEDWQLEFTPEKLLVGYFLGETDDYYHMYIKYRKSQNGMLLAFVPKKAILNPLFIEDFNKKEIDFSKYNTKNFN